MDLKRIFPLICVILLFSAYIKYNQNYYYGNDSKLNEINIKNPNSIEYINSNKIINSIIKLNQDYIIGSFFDTNQIFTNNDHLYKKIANGDLFLYNVKTKEINVIEIINFPKNTPFHPHGLDLYKISNDKYYLYVVNHSNKFQGISEERIEKILVNINNKKTWELPIITLTYQSFYILPKEYFGAVKDIAIISMDTFYFTTHLSFPLLTSSNEDKNIFGIMKYEIFKAISKLYIILNIKNTFLFSYHDGIINKIDGSGGLLNGGLTFDKERNLLFMARTIEKDIKIFEVLRNFPPKALYINSIKTMYNLDSIYYDEETEKLFLGIYGAQKEVEELKDGYLNESFDNVTSYGGFEELDQKNNYQISDIILLKNQLKGITSSVKIQNDIFLSSSFQNGLLIYHRKKYN